MGTPGGTCCVPASLLANPTHSRMIAPANCTSFCFQTGRERLTPQSILLFEAECHEPDRSPERLRAEARRHFKEDHEPTRVIIRAR